MGLRIKKRDRSGMRSVATGSRGGTHGYASGPLPGGVVSKGKAVKKKGGMDAVKESAKKARKKKGLSGKISAAEKELFKLIAREKK